MDLGDRIRDLRQQQQMTLKQLSDKSGVSFSHLSAVERGKARPTYDKLVAISHGLGVSVETITDDGASTSTDKAETTPDRGNSVGGSSRRQSIPAGLAELRVDPAFGPEIDDAWLRALASLSIHGRRPKTKRQWLGLYLVMQPYFEDKP